MDGAFLDLTVPARDAAGQKTVEDDAALLIADPVGVICAEFGCTPGLDFKIEIIEQAEDTIVIMVPPKPEAGQDIEQALT